MAGAWYNEIDEYAAEWLRNLIIAGHIADGVVDTRSIEDVRPDDLREFTQCHFFAGIGIWSDALRRAGWPDDRPVWTGSCPRQPFSAAGKGAGMGDERHLWPAWFHLVDQCRPAILLGEQVASKAAEPWVDLVQSDLETLGYATGAIPFPAASVGAFHIRDRLYWVAHDDGIAGRQGRAITRGCDQGSDAQPWRGLGGSGEPCELAHGGGAGLEGRDQGPVGHERAATERGGGAGRLGHAERIGTGRHTGAGAGAQGGSELRPVGDDVGSSGAVGGLADDDDAGQRGKPGLRLRGPGVHDADGRGARSSWWSAADWIPCRDGKWRPVEPGTFPLAHGDKRRVGRLRAYGNAIVAPQAQVWIETVMECMP